MTWSPRPATRSTPSPAGRRSRSSSASSSSASTHSRPRWPASAPSWTGYTAGTVGGASHDHRPVGRPPDRPLRTCPPDTPAPDDRYVTGGAFILDAPPGVPAVWGSATRCLGRGEPLLIVGPAGVGKTTLAGQLVWPGSGSVGRARHASRPREARAVPGVRPARPDAAGPGRDWSPPTTAGPRRPAGGLEGTRHSPTSPGTPTRCYGCAEQAEADTAVLDSLKDVALSCPTTRPAPRSTRRCNAPSSRVSRSSACTTSGRRGRRRQAEDASRTSTGRRGSPPAPAA